MEGAIQFGRMREWNDQSRWPRNTGAPMQKK